MKMALMETGYKVKLPVEWVTELGLEQNAILERTKEGILIRPLRKTSWDDVFSDTDNKGTRKLRIGKQSDLDLLEVSGDDLLF